MHSWRKFESRGGRHKPHDNGFQGYIGLAKMHDPVPILYSCVGDIGALDTAEESGGQLWLGDVVHIR